MKLEWKSMGNRIIYTNMCACVETVYNMGEEMPHRATHSVSEEDVCLWLGHREAPGSWLLCDQAPSPGHPQEPGSSEQK